ncbi:hypothetical protein C8R44DRAFT_851014 [Mycena epipterygia]|nr:hypothetical protein C8R44DRAFT_851014 [Mycena epipterygia]
MASRVPPTLAADVFTPAMTRAHIEVVDSRLSALQGFMRTLELKRNVLKAHLDAYTYPVSTLPNEIVSEIFLQCVSSSDRADRIPSSRKAPLILGQIFRKWRQISLSTPSLWTTIELRLGNHETHENQLHLLETWLSRSRDCPLSLSIFYEMPLIYIGFGVSYSDYSGDVREFIKAILPHCRRWEYLELIVPFQNLTLIHRELQTPLLRDLTVGITNLDQVRAYGDEPDWPIQMFDHAPQFREIIFALGFDIAVFRLPWEQMTSISIFQPHSPTDLAAVLRSATNVGYFMGEVANQPTTADVEPIPPLAHLHSLNLTADVRSHAYVPLLKKLTLPALHALRLSEASLMYEPGAAVRDLVSRSGCQLLRIVVVDAKYPKRAYRRLWPSVREIVLQRPEDADSSDESSDTSSGEDEGDPAESSDAEQSSSEAED